MSNIKLTDAKIKTLKPQEKVYRLLDADRLYIEVRPTGVKVWRLKYVLNGKESSMSLGEYPSVTLADARQLKDEVRAKLAKGIDPVDSRKKERQAMQGKVANTFDIVAKEYFEQRLNNKSDIYKTSFITSLKKDISPVIGKKDVKDVTAADVLKIIQNTVKRVSKQKNFGTGETTAIQNRKFVGAVMRYAIATLRAENDPTYAVRDVIERPKINHAKPLDRDERRIIRTNIDNYNGSETVQNAGFILLYSMLRSVEIRKMEWPWVDFDKRLVEFPREVMKKYRLHVLPMSDQVYEILKKQYKNSGNKKYVFPAIYKPDGMLDKSTLNRMLKYIGLNDVTAHDFRATASTLLYEKGYEEAWIERQLAHAESNKTKASYDHSQHLDARRKMMQDWADIVDSWKD
ncbi:tyrosine-type recombinase/integrase [Acinetobacter baumannii]|uniref:tyrosine-type recombinase/integrase n=1 Tax=Acinetobacter baumannii TaxID=470 RepID=UPI000D3D27A3|nr:integrase arm-type DNA-binding domain-containing protein [Acinetobacter baumannii]MDC4813827.1 integrase arm-type DNA-binding domain-containing protein [Acinetobacter baumannii]PUV05912.1 integrase [Acinetobacter baumannii]